MEVTLEQMLAAREERAYRQFLLNQQWHRPILSFCMNIAGPVKDSPLIRRGFRVGCEALDCRIPKAAIKHREVLEAVTGCEAVYVLDMEPTKIKAITTAIEDTHALGRLFDMDVLDSNLEKLERWLVQGKSRNCIVCGAPGRECASRRVHRVEELQQVTRGMLARYFQAADAERIGAWAVQSLLEEVYTTPKPGLVDCRNSGSHRDMNLMTFAASAAALGSYFQKCAAIGMETAGASPDETFRRLREAGLWAEQRMYEATNGVNTHKGAIFTIGIFCGAAGRLWKPEGGWHAEALFRETAAMTAKAMAEDFSHVAADTVGQRLYAQKGIRGIRGEAAQGFPSVAQIGLPTYLSCLEQGAEPNLAGVITLLHLIAQVEDTNMISRGGIEKAREAAEKAAQLLSSHPDLAQNPDLAQIPDLAPIRDLDDWFIANNLSPGGCADLLAAVYLVHHLILHRIDR